MQEINAWAVPAVSDSLEPFAYTPKSLKENEVLVDVTHCGICHSDVHLADNDWGFSRFPMVPGHEIVGVVSAVGSNVKHLSAGRRVGIGWQCGSCFDCQDCNEGNEQFCPSHRATCVGHHGGFANQVTADARFAFAIPEALNSEQAAPLLCAGATVFTPMMDHNLKAGQKVGVIGIGGLGHLAVQFASKMGCEVTAFSSSTNKADEAKEFGATHVVSSRDPEAIKALAGQFDLIISTISVPLDWRLWLRALRPTGALCFVGASSVPMDLTPGDFMGGRRSICGSAIGSRAGIVKMLDFAAKHGVKAQTEAFSMETQVNEAFDRVRAGKARYRVVLER